MYVIYLCISIIYSWIYISTKVFGISKSVYETIYLMEIFTKTDSIF